ncbi:MAG TPA: NifU family protein [Magnetospirillaceae bacterium]|jgi:Fe-S cluster biogenesis protein NfuA
MFIQTETTPNPNTLKFLPGRAVLETGTADFPDRDTAARSPLALRLFALDGVTRVFLGSDFITVAKPDETDWAVVKPMVLGAIMDHYTSGEATLSGEHDSAAGAIPSGEDSEIVVQIKELLDTRVRPSVAGDGGDIIFRGFEDGVVYLHMQGSCSGCPSSTATLKHGIENLLKYYVPEVQAVEAVE